MKPHLRKHNGRWLCFTRPTTRYIGIGPTPYQAFTDFYFMLHVAPRFFEVT